MEEKKWSEKVTKKEVLQSIGEKRALLNPALKSQLDWSYSKRNFPLHNVIEGQFTELKGEEQNSLKICKTEECELKNEAEDRKVGNDNLPI